MRKDYIIPIILAIDLRSKRPPNQAKLTPVVTLRGDSENRDEGQRERVEEPSGQEERQVAVVLIWEGSTEWEDPEGAHAERRPFVSARGRGWWGTDRDRRIEWILQVLQLSE